MNKVTLLIFFLFFCCVSVALKETRNYDVVIYGSTPAAITAALQVQRMGKTVVIVSPENHIGGLTTSGLGWTDSKNGNAIGGLAREFYSRIYQYYLNDKVWNLETRKNYLDKKIGAQPGPAIQDDKKVQWTFEPKAAEAVYESWLKQFKIPVFRGEFLNRTRGGVKKVGAKIVSFETLSGKVFSGLQFIDCGYEGDLMAAAGISYKVGRDSASQYNESLGGKRIVLSDEGYHGIDPYVIKGDPSSGLLYGIETTVPSPLPSDFIGSEDKVRLQSFNFRLPLTRASENRIPFDKPEGYKVEHYELLLRLYETGRKGDFTSQLMPNKKTDSNSSGRVSFDLLGGSYNWKTGTTYSDSTYEQRQAMYKNHKDWQKGFLYTLANNPRIPPKLRTMFNGWGYAADEFVQNGHWPYQLYVREARRMSGVYTLTQKDVQKTNNYTGDVVIGLGSYSLDSHVVRRVVVGGKIYDEGGFYLKNRGMYPIPYNTIIPMKKEATNFLNPITLSASHVAFGSVRMEPTYMILGQSAGTAAVLAIQQGKDVQDIDRKKLYERLQIDQQHLHA